MERRFKDLIEHIEVPLDTVKKAEDLLCQEDKKQKKVHTKLEYMTYHLKDASHKRREHIVAAAALLVVICSASVGGVALYHAKRDMSYQYSNKYPGVGEERWFLSGNSSSPEATQTPEPEVTAKPKETNKPVVTKKPVETAVPKKTAQPTEKPVSNNRVADELRTMVIDNGLVKISNTTVIDLNGDDSYDKITYQYSEDKKACILSVGKAQLIIEDTAEKHQLYLGAFGSNNELFIIIEDVNEDWNKISQIYQYNGKEIDNIGMIQGCMDEARVLDNLLVTRSKSKLVNTWTKTHYYVTEYDEKTGKTYIEEKTEPIVINQISKVLQDVESYQLQDENSTPIVLDKDTIVTIVETDDQEWVKLQAESSQQEFWIHLDPKTQTISLPDQTQVSLAELLLLGTK